VTMALHFRLYNRRQRELEAARRQVEEYAKIKSKLFAGMSHEMRTPLTVMSAYAQFAVEQIKESLSAGQPWANEKILADLATISDEAKRLAEMADGTLKILMAVSEPDEIILQKSIPVDMENLITRLAGLLEPVASRKGKKLTVVTGENIPLISGDADALAQLVWNILQNAITHSDGKNVTLTVSNFENAVKVTTADDGSGIEPKILPHIFEPGVSGKKGGSGIGLSICRDIVKRHNGEINIKSNKEEGTIVTLQMRGIK
ncbi:MAG: HAMP domain-containing histidine kinase, partial [Treponema sp.]|nr:HAMP domain-containing histidine kinase [Treponema sp.]MCL2237582.1 HAMP domain-containing histidine kinase [Treponema sp.]